MAPAVCPWKHKIILQDAAQCYVLNCGPAAINTTCYHEEASFQRCFKIIRLRLQLTAFHGSLFTITNINMIFRTFTRLCKSQQSLCHRLPFYQCVTEFKVFRGIQNKPDSEHPTEPHTKHPSANERFHGNDDGAWIPFKCTRLPLWCEWKTSAPGGCSLTQGKLNWKSATGDYYNSSWPLAFHIRRWEQICFGFDSYLRFKPIGAFHKSIS